MRSADTGRQIVTDLCSSMSASAYALTKAQIVSDEARIVARRQDTMGPTQQTLLSKVGLPRKQTEIELLFLR